MNREVIQFATDKGSNNLNKYIMKAIDILTVLELTKKQNDIAKNIEQIFSHWKKEKSSIANVKVFDFGLDSNKIDSKKYTIESKTGIRIGSYSFLMPVKLCPFFNEVLGLETKHDTKTSFKSIHFETGFQDAINKAVALCDKKSDPFRQLKTNILLDFNDGKCTIVYTNCHLLYESKVFDTDFKESIEIQLPINELKKYKVHSFNFDNSSNNIYSINGNKFTFVPESKFPRYKNILPDNHNKRILFNGKKMLQAIKTAKPYVNKSSQVAKLHLNGSIGLHIKNEDYGRNFETEMPYKEKQGFEVFDIGVNLLLLESCIKAFQNKTIEMTFSEPNSAMLIKSEGELCLLMPMMLNNY